MQTNHPQWLVMKITASSLLVVACGMSLFACVSKPQHIDRADIERIITTLSADDMGGRRVFSPGIERAARFIQNEFAAIELETLDDLDGYMQRFTVSERVLANVAGMIRGRRRDEIVLFSAHYDHLGIVRPVGGDSIANGANDDASGTTAVISLAKYFKALGEPERTLMFVAFTAEESGGHGSRYFSEQVDPHEIVAMFNIEMIGKPTREGPNTAWITGFERSTFGGILREAVEDTPYSFYPDPYIVENLFSRSDNAIFARLGVPAHTIFTTPIDVDRDYHQVTDEVATLDLDHMTATIEALAMGAATIVSGAATPTRVDVSKLN